MLQTIRNQVNVLLLGLFCFICLPACTSKPQFSFQFFPIEEIFFPDWDGGYFPLSNGIRIIFSIAWYVFLLGVFITIPLLITNSFKSRHFYKSYKMFWWHGAFIYSSLTAVLTGIIPNGLGQVILFIICYFVILFITLFPAYLQHKWTNPPNK